LPPVYPSSGPTPAFEVVEEEDEDYDYISYDQDSDYEEIESHIDRELAGHTMAAEFTEGRLETTVSNPQKELPGTKDAYVSYLVTTKVT
jgi:sorting nexin-4